MKITMNFIGLDKVQRTLAKLTTTEARAAYAKAINDTAFEVRRKMQSEMSAVFDRPTPYILRSVQFNGATPDLLEANVQPTYYGGKGIDPQKVLAAEVEGGTRRDKSSEAALRRVGILPAGYQTAIPKDPYPGSADAYGNLKGSYLVQILSYFQAFAEQGYRANMGAKRKAALAKGKGNTGGVRYIVTYGGLRGGSRTTASGEADRRASNLPAGIWAIVGNTGAVVRPVLMFVKAGSYRVRLDLDRVAQQAGGIEYLSKRLRYRIRQAAGE